jgi:hypothetical protein
MNDNCSIIHLNNIGSRGHMAKGSKVARRRNANKGRSSKKYAKNVIRDRPPGKQEVPIKGSNTMPEIFDSSVAGAMVEMKGSATMNQRDFAKAVSHIQKQEPMQPESVTTRPAAAEAENISSPAVNPTIEERASVVKESERAASGRTDDDEVFV